MRIEVLLFSIGTRVYSTLCAHSIPTSLSLSIQPPNQSAQSQDLAYSFVPVDLNLNSNISPISVNYCCTISPLWSQCQRTLSLYSFSQSALCGMPGWRVLDSEWVCEWVSQWVSDWVDKTIQGCFDDWEKEKVKMLGCSTLYFLHVCVLYCTHCLIVIVLYFSPLRVWIMISATMSLTKKWSEDTPERYGVISVKVSAFSHLSLYVSSLSLSLSLFPSLLSVSLPPYFPSVTLRTHIHTHPP